MFIHIIEANYKLLHHGLQLASELILKAVINSNTKYIKKYLSY